MKKLKSLCILFIITISFQLSAQVNPIKQFSEDPIKFLEEVKTMFEVTSMEKKEVKEFMEKFTIVWNSPKYTQSLRKQPITLLT